MYKTKIFSIMLSAVFAILIFGTFSYGGVPQMINYQGTLTDKNGTPVSNGNYDIEFKIYDAAAPGGNLLWSEKWDAGSASPIPVVDGIFNVMLGFHSPIPASFFADHPVTYLGIKVGTDSEMTPRQQITSVGYAFTAGNGVPKGGVIMWSGAVDQIPAGWALCDGANGTPNLKDKFVVGAGNLYAIGVTGGNTSINFAHLHAVDNHSHSIAGDNGNEHTGEGEHTRGSSAGHAHNGATGGASPSTDTKLSTSQDIRPPYYALAYIMKL